MAAVRRANAWLESRIGDLRREVREAEAAGLLQNVVDRVGMSARAYDRILKVARTIADLDTSDEIHVSHIQEAVNYRMLDRQLWT